MGNPGVFQGYLYLYPSLPIPMVWGMGFAGYRLWDFGLPIPIPWVQAKKKTAQDIDYEIHD